MKSGGTLSVYTWKPAAMDSLTISPARKDIEQLKSQTDCAAKSKPVAMISELQIGKKLCECILCKQCRTLIVSKGISRCPLAAGVVNQSAVYILMSTHHDAGRSKGRTRLELCTASCSLLYP